MRTVSFDPFSTEVLVALTLPSLHFAVAAMSAGVARKIKLADSPFRSTGFSLNFSAIARFETGFPSGLYWPQ
jgi:hypothetical protein